MSYHTPVLLHEAIEGLAIKADGVYVDATFGGGGHSKSILRSLSAKGCLYGFDQDADAISNTLEDERFVFVHSNFRHLKRFLRLHKVKQVDGLLADLGVSSFQFDTPSRGFSYRADAELDMRMNNHSGETAADVLNQYDESDLLRIFSEYGEIRNSKTLASHVVKRRKQKRFDRINDFLEFLDTVGRGEKIKYYSQVFQSLRIELNDEMGALKDFLEQAGEVMAEGARLVVISYHSLEDRMVKRFLKTGNVAGEVVKDDFGNIHRPFKSIGGKMILPSKDEIASNPRARSAKMRIGEKLQMK